MNNYIKTIVTKLLEEFGVYNIFNKKYHNNIKNISTEIISKLSYISKQSEIDYKSSLITKDEIYYTNVYHFDLNLDWLKTLNNDICLIGIEIIIDAFSIILFL